MFPRAPFVRLLIPFMLGIVIQPFTGLFWLNAFYILFSVLGALLIYQAIIRQNEKFVHRQRYGFLLNVLLCSTGLFLSCVQSQCLSDCHIDHIIEDVVALELVLIEKPVERVKSYRCFAEIRGAQADSIGAAEGNILIYFGKCEGVRSLAPGHRIVCYGKIQKPPTPKNPGEFNYAAYLKRKGCTAQVYLDSTSWKLTRNQTDNFLFVRWREFMLERFRKYVDEGDVFQVLSALVLGKTSELDRDLMAHYSGAGAIHILAVSGLHVGLLYLLLVQMFKLIFGTRAKWIRFTLIALVLWTYAAITGFSPSVLRSTVMFSAVLIGTSLNKNSDIFNSLASSAFVLLVFNPQMIYDIGFQMSYLAVIGIVVFQKGFESLVYVKSGIMYRIWQLTSVSLAAQIITFPLGLYYFGQFPNYFLIANLLVIPLSTGILYLAIFFFIISWIPFLAECTGWLLSRSTELLNYIVEVTDELPWSKTEDVSISILWCIVLMVISFLFTYMWQHKRSNWIGMVAMSISILIIISTIEEIYMRRESPTICFHSLREGLAVSYLIDDRIYYIYMKEDMAADGIVHRSLAGYWRNSGREVAQFINLSDSIRYGDQYIIESENAIFTETASISIDPKTVLFSEKILGFVILDKTQSKLDSLSINSLAEHSAMLVVSADMSKYKFNKLLSRLRPEFHERIHWLGEGALVVGGGN